MHPEERPLELADKILDGDEVDGPSPRTMAGHLLA